MLGKQIKAIRDSFHMSQVELAAVLHVSKQSISNWENENILPSIEMLERIARYFSVSSDYLLGLDERRFIEVTGLSDEELAHIQVFIHDLTRRKAENT